MPKANRADGRSPVRLEGVISFIESLTIEHGPIPLLGRFFAEADATLRNKGVLLGLGALTDAVDVQALQEASWHSFPPMLDPGLHDENRERSYCLLGYDPDGEIVTVQAGRIFEGDGTLSEWFSSGKFIYGTRTPGPWFRFHVTAPAAGIVHPPFVYSGALWVHPRLRGSKLAGVLVRLSRAYALARWNTAYTIACVSEEMAASPMPAIYGYSRIEPSVRVENLPDGTRWDGRLMWMDRAELVADLERFLVHRLPQIDGGIVTRAAHEDR